MLTENSAVSKKIMKNTYWIFAVTFDRWI